MGCSLSRADQKTRPVTSRVGMLPQQEEDQRYEEEDEVYDDPDPQMYNYGGPEEDEERIPCEVSFQTFMSSPGEKRVFEYKFLRLIGRGTGAEVYLILNTETNTYYAAKVYDKTMLQYNTLNNGPTIQKVLQEIQVMSMIKCKYCIQFKEVLEDQVYNAYYIIEEFADNGCLLPQKVKTTPIPEEKAKDVFFQICQGVRYLHSKNIVHRDLKPENIMTFSDGHVAIGDYSAARFMIDSEYLDDTEGTPAFTSPEQFTGQPFKGKPADVWACGVSLFIMLFGYVPFLDGSNNDSVYLAVWVRNSERVKNDPLVFPDSILVSDDAKDLILHLMDKNPDTRFTINDALHHKWFQSLPNYNEVMSSLYLPSIAEKAQN